MEFGKKFQRCTTNPKAGLLDHIALIWTHTNYIWGTGPISKVVFDLEVVKWHLNHSEYLILP